MRGNDATRAAVRALQLLRLIVLAHEELGDSAVLQTVQTNHEEAREVLNALKGKRISVRQAIRPQTGGAQ